MIWHEWLKKGASAWAPETNRMNLQKTERLWRLRKKREKLPRSLKSKHLWPHRVLYLHHRDVCVRRCRGEHVDGDPAQQHRGHQTPTVFAGKPAFGSLWLRNWRGAAIGCHQPIGALRAGTVLPVQEVPPPQHSRWSVILFSSVTVLTLDNFTRFLTGGFTSD